MTTLLQPAAPPRQDQPAAFVPYPLPAETQAPAIADSRLPDGWEVAEYTGRGARPYFAVYANGRRMASGMTDVASAARWARLLASAGLSTAP